MERDRAENSVMFLIWVCHLAYRGKARALLDHGFIMFYQREQGRTVIKAVGEKAVESSRCAPLKANSASENEDRDVGELTWGDRWEY